VHCTVCCTLPHDHAQQPGPLGELHIPESDHAAPVGFSAMILIEAPSLTYHVVGWAWEKLTKERRRPQAILHQAAPVLLRHRSTCPQHVPLYLQPGGRDSAPPEHARWPRTVSEGRRTLPGRSGRLCRMDSSPGSGWPTSVRAKGCRLCSATRSI
jgi:hypothetical protein